ncbi:MAG: CDP-glucose 4,6-dehydratase [Chitinivibrionales bacterium]|nr:CDP-glucose 4,6-dehydratase [Chitinivibrionales bacterium]
MNKLFNGIYENRRVFITGHTGFKGSWLALWLTKMGAKAAGYSLAPSTNPNHISLLNLDMESTLDTILDLESLSTAMNRFNPDIVFHLAAQPLVRYSYSHPYETYETNVMGTLNVCEAARKCKSVTAIVAITTDKVYENKEWEWGYRENDRLGGYDPYSSSKACAEILLSSYRNSFLNLNDYGSMHNILLSTVRAGNVIGGGDWSIDRLIPDIMKATAAGKPVDIRNPSSTRPWQHVLECLGGYLRVGQVLLEGRKDIADSINFGPVESDNLSVDDVCELVHTIWPQTQFDFPDNTSRLHEAGALRLDCSKARTLLDWKPLWKSARAIRLTVEWYRRFYGEKSITSENDLYEYVKDAHEGGAVWAQQF